MGVATDNFIQKPHLSFILGFVIAIAYIPGFLGAAIPTGWLVLIIVMPIIFVFCKFEFNIITLLGTLFIIFNALSLIWTPNFNIGFFILLQIIALSCVFCFGSNLEHLENCFKGLALGLGVSSVIAISQRLGYKPVFTIGSDITGLFVNPNIYSEVSALMLVSLIVLRLWYWIPVTLPGLILIQSRTAFVGLGIGLFCWFYLKNKLYAVASVIVIGMIGFIFFNRSFSISSIQERFDLWRDTIKGLNWLGNGIGSYELLFPLNAIYIDTSVARPKFAHNDLLQVVFENGIFSITLILIIGLILWMKNELGVILITVGTMSLLTYSLHIPMEIFIACLVAGYIVGRNATNWNIGDSIRSIVFAWFKNRGIGIYKIS